MGSGLMDGYKEKLEYLNLVEMCNLPNEITAVCRKEDVETLVGKKDAALFLGACRFDAEGVCALVQEEGLYEFLYDYWTREDISTEDVKRMLGVILKAGVGYFREHDEAFRIIANWLPGIKAQYGRNDDVEKALAAAARMEDLSDRHLSKLQDNQNMHFIEHGTEDFEIFFKVRFPVLVRQNQSQQAIALLRQEEEACEFFSVLTDDVRKDTQVLDMPCLEKLVAEIEAEDVLRYQRLQEKYQGEWESFLAVWEEIGFTPELLRRLDAETPVVEEMSVEGLLTVIYPECEGRLDVVREDEKVMQCLLHAAILGKEKFMEFALGAGERLLELSYSSNLFYTVFRSAVIDLDEVDNADALEDALCADKLRYDVMPLLFQTRETVRVRELRMFAEENFNSKQVEFYLQLRKEIGEAAMGRVQEAASALSACKNTIYLRDENFENLVRLLVRKSFKDYYEEQKNRIPDIGECTVIKAVLLGVSENELLMQEIASVAELEFVLRCVAARTCDAATITLDYLKENFCKVQPDYLQLMKYCDLQPEILDVYGRVMYELSVNMQLSDIFRALGYVANKRTAQEILAVLRAICEHRFEEVRYSREVLEAEIQKDVDEVIAFNWFQDAKMEFEDATIHISGGYDGLLAAVSKLPGYYFWEANFLVNACVKTIWAESDGKIGSVGKLILTKARDRDPLWFRDVLEDSTPANERLVLLLLADAMPESMLTAASRMSKMVGIPLVYKNPEGKQLAVYAPRCRIGNGSRVMRFVSYEDEEYSILDCVVEVNPFDE